MFPIKSQILKSIGTEPSTMDELGAAILKLVNKKRKVAGFKWQITHGSVSNTHSAPEGKTINWWCKSDMPTKYPGWSGRIWVRYKKYATGFGSDPFSGTLTYPGTGGAGAYDGPWKDICAAHWNRFGYKQPKNAYPEPICLSWDYRLFDADWALATTAVGQDQVCAILRKERFVEPTHIFEWYDKAVVAEDAAFIEECNFVG
jgi:hypothetical protein